MLNEEIISMVKNNIHHYECTSLANDDVERLFVVIRRMQKQNSKLKKGLLEARSIVCPGENVIPQAEERTEITKKKTIEGDKTVSTEYYALKKPITSIRPEVMGGHTHVGIWVNHAKSGILVFCNNEWKDAIWLFVDASKSAMRAFASRTGCVVEETDTSSPAEQQMVSEYGELMTVGEIRAKAKH